MILTRRTRREKRMREVRRVSDVYEFQDLIIIEQKSYMMTFIIENSSIIVKCVNRKNADIKN
jgi:hypothetical protein